MIRLKPGARPAYRSWIGSSPAAGRGTKHRIGVATHAGGSAGAGNPVDVPPVRVAEFLDGKEATPFEITAAEVLLARWAGVPARLGYGYYDPQGAAEIRPRNGATWLDPTAILGPRLVRLNATFTF